MQMLENIINKGESIGLKINKNKTKLMRIGKQNGKIEMIQGVRNQLNEAGIINAEEIAMDEKRWKTIFKEVR